jgi:hypothetical protein
MKWYGNALLAAFNKEIDFGSDTIKLMGTTSAHTPNQDTHDYVDDIRAAEETGTNWSAGGATLANCTVTYTAGTNVVKFDADDVSVATVTVDDMKNLHVYDDTPATDATKPLIGFAVLDTALAPSAGTLAVTFDSAGILTATAAA